MSEETTAGRDAEAGPVERTVGRPAPERSVRHLLTPDMIAAEDAAGGVFAAGALARCHSDNDGDCVHPECPQLRDGEPHKSGRSCPLYDWEWSGE